MVLKLICFHGKFQNAAIFREKTGSFRKRLKPFAELVYIDAPFQVPTGEENPTGDANLRSWYYHPHELDRCTHERNGFDAAVEYTSKIFTEQGPFDGIFAFSQGATFAAVLCALKQHNLFNHEFKFVILASGPKSDFNFHESYFEEKIKIPSLHIIGEADNIITKDRSEALANQFEEPKILYHPGGHGVPASASCRDEYKKFIERFL